MLIIPKGYTIIVNEDIQIRKKKKFIWFIKNYFSKRFKVRDGIQTHILRGFQVFFSSDGKEFYRARVISEMKPEIRSYYGYESLEWTFLETHWNDFFDNLPFDFMWDIWHTYIYNQMHCILYWRNFYLYALLQSCYIPIEWKSPDRPARMQNFYGLSANQWEYYIPKEEDEEPDYYISLDRIYPEKSHYHWAHDLFCSTQGFRDFCEFYLQMLFKHSFCAPKVLYLWSAQSSSYEMQVCLNYLVKTLPKRLFRLYREGCLSQDFFNSVHGRIPIVILKNYSWDPTMEHEFYSLLHHEHTESITGSRWRRHYFHRVIALGSHPLEQSAIPESWRAHFIPVEIKLPAPGVTFGSSDYQGEQNCAALEESILQLIFPIVFHYPKDFHLHLFCRQFERDFDDWEPDDLDRL